jgi:carboxyl-terminal processing protease
LENFTGRVVDDFKGEPGIFVALNPQNRVQIYRVLDNSPAEAVGLKNGDLLIAINGRSLTTIPRHQIQSLLEGDVGSTVKLTVSRAGNVHHFDVERKVLANGKPPTGN